MRPNENGIFLTREMAGGRTADVYAIFGGKARIALSAPGNRWVYDEVW